MKISPWVYALSGLIILSSVACNNQHQQKAGNETEHSQDIYTCSMHPQVQVHQPGNCPICGMQLIKKNTKPLAASDIELEKLLKPANKFVISTLATIKPEKKAVDIQIQCYGAVEYDTRGAVAISARVSGRIEKLYVRYLLQPVKRGQKLMDVYSPELLTAQQNLLFLLKNDASNTSFISAAKEKLLLLGMSEKELQKVIETGKPLMAVGVYSSYDGHVHGPKMSHLQSAASEMTTNENVTGELSLKEGMYFQKGETLLMIMNHHDVWAALHIFPADQASVKVGLPVSLIPETDTAAVITGHIDYIEPFLRENSKTVTARVYFHNMAMIPIGSQVRAKIDAGNLSAFWLPQSAVISLGMNQVVLLKKEGGFYAHAISTGKRAVNDIQIVTGLSDKDSVIANASYLIDSESFIQTSSK